MTTRAALLIGLLLFTIDLAPAPRNFVLARLDRLESGRIPALFRNRIQVIQELDSAWIAVIPEEAAAALQAKGVAVRILDSGPLQDKYFLVFTGGTDDRAELGKFGTVRAIDEATCLFWTDDGGEAREVLPAKYRLKALSPADRVVLASDDAAAAESRMRLSVLKPPFYDQRIASLVDQVSQANLSGSILQLQSFASRYASGPGCALAGDYLLNYFSQIGLAAAADPFTFSSYSSRNIVATLPGISLPEYVVIVCAHYDSTSSQAATAAPGADDNASGTAAVMEIARILSSTKFDFTLKFICFSAEEWGLYGSRHYAQAARSRGEKIIGVINMDMIAYTDRLPEDLDVFANPGSQWLGNRFAICAAQYLPLPVLNVLNAGMRGSDHSPFWDQGYSAVCAIEDYPLQTPYYHRPTDLFTTLNMDFAAAATKIALAAAAGLAQTALQ